MGGILSLGLRIYAQPERIAKLEISKLERYKLINQLLILEALYPQESGEFAKQREIFENGYELLYDSVMEYIADGEDTLSSEECSEVWDVLDMFEGIYRSIENANKSFEDFGPNAKFDGYDGNNETKFMGFSEFTVRKEGRWTYLPLSNDDYFNSHSPRRGRYNQMLNKFRNFPRGERYSLSEEQLNDLLSTME